MKKSLFSKKELKNLAKRLAYLLERGVDKKSEQVQMLVRQIRFILGQIGFRKRQLRRIFGTAVVLLGLGLTQHANAQASFVAPSTNPFGLSAAYNTAGPVEADLDNDGDLDLLVTEYYGNFKFYQNIGTSAAPAFAAPVQNPFGLTAAPTYSPKLTFADMDNDGDLDLMAAVFNPTTYAGDVRYYQNTGTATTPAFAAPITNPFGITPGFYFKAPELVDLDNDGDYDLISIEYNYAASTSSFSYQQNIGTATAPNFAAVQLAPFGLAFPSTMYTGHLTTGDIDNDGDFDLIFGASGYSSNFYYYQNIGSATAPAFAAPNINPFGLVATNSSSSYQKKNNACFLDMDNDGDLDIISGDYGGNLVYFRNVIISSGPLTVFNVTVSTPSCSPGGDGSITVAAGGGVGPITYKIGLDSNTTGTFNNYTTGSYTVRVRDSVNTIIDTMITINASIPPNFDSANTFISNVSCNGANDGFLAISTTGGTAPLSYQLLPSFSSPQLSSFYSGLNAGAYTVIITDAKNCADSNAINITQPAPLTLTVDSTTNPICFGSVGSIYTSVAGGTAGYVFSISPNVGTQSSPGDFSNLPAGNYVITCTDANSCSTNITQTLTQPANTINITIGSVTNVSCFGGNNGGLIATATGAASFVYSIAPNTGSQTPPGNFTGLSANNYVITATDPNGCSNTAAQIITQAPQILLSVINKLDASSASATDGSITSSATGGTGSITYSISPNTGTQSPPGTFSNLGVGNYTITATDANNCTVTTTSTINFASAVNEIDKRNIKLYPNPVMDALQLESDIEIKQLSILDITGKLVKQFEKPATIISVGDMPIGIYIVKIVLKNEEVYFTRITKQ